VARGWPGRQQGAKEPLSRGKFYYLRMQPHTSKWTILLKYLLPGLFASALVLSALAEFHKEISDPWLIHFDQWGMQSLRQHVSPAMTHLMLALTFIGSVKVYLPFVLFLALYLWRAQYNRQALLLLVGVCGAGILNTLLKLHFRRLRPDVPWALIHEHNFSFPSGHSTAAFALYGMLAYLLIDHIRSIVGKIVLILVAVMLVLGIGTSRVYLGVHYPSDVAAGYLVGFIWLATLIEADLHVRHLAKADAQCSRCH